VFLYGRRHSALLHPLFAHLPQTLHVTALIPSVRLFAQQLSAVRLAPWRGGGGVLVLSDCFRTVGQPRSTTKDEGGRWFTDSLNQVLYRVALAADGRPTGQAEVQTVPLTGDIRFEEGFNANGIDATPNGKRLVIVQSNTGQLFRVDPASGSTLEIDLGGVSVMDGDGVLLAGRRIYVVQNQQNAIAVIRLKGKLTSGEILRRITSPDFDIPTTIAREGRWLYAVNARFGTEPTPETEYWITRVPR
jgi:hypothetical protein